MGENTSIDYWCDNTVNIGFLDRLFFANGRYQTRKIKWLDVSRSSRRIQATDTEVLVGQIGRWGQLKLLCRRAIVKANSDKTNSWALGTPPLGCVSTGRQYSLLCGSFCWSSNRPLQHAKYGDYDQNAAWSHLSISLAPILLLLVWVIVFYPLSIGPRPPPPRHFVTTMGPGKRWYN